MCDHSIVQGSGLLLTSPSNYLLNKILRALPLPRYSLSIVMFVTHQGTQEILMFFMLVASDLVFLPLKPKY